MILSKLSQHWLCFQGWQKQTGTHEVENSEEKDRKKIGIMSNTFK